MSAAERIQKLKRLTLDDTVPNPWGALLALACFTLIASVIGIALLERYLDSRPLHADIMGPAFIDGDSAGLAHAHVSPDTLPPLSAQWASFAERTDLTARTAQIAARLQDALRAAGSTRIETERTELRENSSALWHYALMKARFPSPAAARNLTPRLSMGLADDSIRIDRIAGAPEGQTWLSVRCQGIECVTLHAMTDTMDDPSVKLAAFAVALNGLDPDDVVREFYPDSDALPLDSTDMKIDAPMPSSTPGPTHEGPLRLAIIVDDGGYGGWVTEEILSLPNTLTLSILPHAPYSYETARRATQLGFEVMLHMPMENVSGKTTYPGEITVNMDANQMLDLTNQALADVPGAVGINNHTGSKFTSNAAAMRTWLDLIKDSGFFFIDSRTSHAACAYEVAYAMTVPSAENDLFLDHDGNPDAIRARFKQIMAMVKQRGQAIAICHFRKNTVPVLKAMMPVFEKEGIEIVHASTLVH